MLDFITKFFKREEASKTLAKERLRLVLMSDRVSLAPDVFDEMKGEMLAVIRRYLEIDERALDMHFENLERQFALLASIPVLKVKAFERSASAEGAVHHDAASNGSAASNGTTASNGAAASNGVATIDQGEPASGVTRNGTPRRRRRRRRAAGPSTSTPQDQAPPDQPLPEPSPPGDFGPDAPA